VLVLGRFDFGVRPAVDAELLVRQDVLFLGQVLVYLFGLGPEIDVLDEDAGGRVLPPKEWRIGMAFAGHSCFSLMS
jgi:hypothetical protein